MVAQLSSAAPEPPRVVASSISNSATDEGAHLEDGQDDRHGDKSDYSTHADDHDWFDHAGYGLYRVSEGFRVEDRDLLEHLAQAAGFLAGRDHLHDRGGQQPGADELGLDLLALLDRRVHAPP